MKNHLVRAVVFIVFGIVCFTVSTLSNDMITESRRSFFFGFSFPLFVFGLIAIVQYFRQKRKEE